MVDSWRKDNLSTSHWAYLKPNIKSWHNFHSVSGDKSLIKKLFSNLNRLFVNSIKGFIFQNHVVEVYLFEEFLKRKSSIILNRDYQMKKQLYT